MTQPPYQQPYQPQPYQQPYYGPPMPPPRDPRRRKNVLVVVLCVGITVLLGGAYVGWQLYQNHEGRAIRASYQQIYDLDKTDCFIPSGSSRDDDRAIRALGSCTEPAASIRVTEIVDDFGKFEQSAGNSSMSALREDGTSSDRVACVTTNFANGHCYRQAGTPTLIGIVDCTDAKLSRETYEVAVGYRYGVARTSDACGPPPARTYIQTDREAAFCTKLF